MSRRLDVKIIITLLATALVPLGVSIYLVAEAVDSSLGLGINEEIAAQMQRSLDTYRAYVASLKHGQKVRFEHLVDSRSLSDSVASRDEDRVRAVLEEIVEGDPSLRSVRLESREGRSVVVQSTGVPQPKPVRTTSHSAGIELGSYRSLEAVFAVDASIISAFERTADDVATYQALVSAPPAYLSRAFILVYVVMLGAVVAVSTSLGIVWTRRLMRRIRRLSRATREVASGNLSLRVQTGPHDELGILIASFNRMVAELALNRSRIEYLQKISAWQEMARRLAHEIKNPLTPIHLAAQQLREKYGGDDPRFSRLLEQSTEIIEEEVATLRRLTSDFSAFARLPRVEPVVVDLRSFLVECAGSLGHLGERDDIELAWNIPERRIPVRIDTMLMKRVIDNLVRNAAEALSEAGVEEARIEISTELSGGKRQREVSIRITDNGPGITPAHHQSIFDPYFTTKSSGTGLGLSISKKIVLEHGGRIQLDEKAPAGASFVISLPVTVDPGSKEEGSSR
ncbi:MAG: ATP-binding protein [Polyangia bacterium]